MSYSARFSLSSADRCSRRRGSLNFTRVRQFAFLSVSQVREAGVVSVRGKPETLLCEPAGPVCSVLIRSSVKNTGSEWTENIAMPEVLVSHGAAPVPRPSRQAAESDTHVATAVESGS
jgi:hypothetical protein